MTARLQSLFILLALSSMMGCAGARPKADWATAPDADFSARSTYAWADGPAGQPRSVLHSQVRNALSAELEKKGYEESPDDSADFRVNYEVVEYDERRRSSPVRIGIGLGSWGRHVGGSIGTSVGVGGGDPGESYRLMIRAISPDRSQELWVGGTTTFEMPAEEQVIERVVTGVMEGFPDSSP